MHTPYKGVGVKVYKRLLQTKLRDYHLLSNLGVFKTTGYPKLANEAQGFT
jgi:hypothetical protein